MSQPFIDAWQQLGCAYDDFVRTTEPRHKERAQELWKRCLASGDIYEGEYEGAYCVGCEAYYTDKDLLEGGLCPQHKKPVEKLKEKTFFFKLSDYTDRLLAFYEAHPSFVQPQGRFNEVKSFVREGLNDISVSRTTFKWGVPVPDHADHVMYVWFDALTNYLSVLAAPPREGETSEKYQTFWPQAGTDNAHAVHIVGKDILRFHAVYWPAFLMSAGIEPPTQVWAHGWLTVNGDKMSKSLGNFLAPGPIVDAVGKDVLRYFLMRDIAFGQDGDFSHDNLFARYHGDLGNGLGNLLNRMVASIVKKSLGGVVPALDEAALLPADHALIARAKSSAERAYEFGYRLFLQDHNQCSPDCRKMDGLEQSHIPVLIDHGFDGSDHHFALPLGVYLKPAMHGQLGGG
jgi:methionyl-tRNA synthetase